MSNIPPIEQRCLDVANRLISQCKTTISKIKSIADIDSNLIVLLFEDITHINIPDFLGCNSKTEEAHNVQAVIDTLSLDILGISLSHITGEDVVAGDSIAICNLFEVLEGVSIHLTSSDQGQNITRKVSRKRKSKVSFSQQNSSNAVDPIKNISSTEIKVASYHTSDFPSSSYQFTRLRRKRSRLRSSNIKSSHSTSGSEKYVTNEKLLHHSTKGHHHPKLIEQNHGVKIAAPKKPLTDDELNYCKENKHIIKRKYHAVLSEKIKNENKPHLHTETAVINDIPEEQNLQESAPANIKRKVVKLTQAGKKRLCFERKQEIEDLYENNLEKRLKILVEKNSSYKPRAYHMKKMHINDLRKPVKKSPVLSCKKSFLLPHSLRNRSVSQTTRKGISLKKAKSSQNTPKHSDKKLAEETKSGFIQELFEEFPGIQLTPQITNLITMKYQKHIIKMHKKVKNYLLKKPKTQVQAEEAAKKQSALSNILKKDIRCEQYLKELKEQKKYENAIKYHLRDARLQSAKMKHYCDEFHTEMRKKLQKRNYAEELIFEKVFMDALKIQKDHVDHLCQEVKETGENDAKKHLIYLDALENLYQSQYAVLSESLAVERKDTEDRIKAEKQVMNSMQREFREELKNEIRFMQRAIIECMEDTHFRQLDAEQYTRKLRNRLS